MCELCPRATYADEVGSTQCSTCSFGLSSPIGSSSLTNCSLDASYVPFPATFPAFSATDTNLATQNTVDQTGINMCGGYTARFSSCVADGESASGYYNNLRLYNAAGTQVAAGGVGINNNYGASLTYAFTGACQTYVFKQGCWSTVSCAGTVAIIVTGAQPAISSSFRSRSIFIM